MTRPLVWFDMLEVMLLITADHEMGRHPICRDYCSMSLGYWATLKFHIFRAVLLVVIKAVSTFSPESFIPLVWQTDRLVLCSPQCRNKHGIQWGFEVTPFFLSLRPYVSSYMHVLDIFQPCFQYVPIVWFNFQWKSVNASPKNKIGSV